MKQFEIPGLILALALTAMGVWTLNYGKPDEAYGAFFDLGLAALTAWVALAWKPTGESQENEEIQGSSGFLKDFLRWTLPALLIALTAAGIWKWFGTH